MLLTLFPLVRRSQERFNGGIGTSLQHMRETYHHLRSLNQTSWLKFGHHQMYRRIQNGGEYEGNEGVCAYLFTHALTKVRLSNLQADKQMLPTLLPVPMSYFLSYCKIIIIFIYTAGFISVYPRKTPKTAQKRAPYPPPGGHLIRRGSPPKYFTIL